MMQTMHLIRHRIIKRQQMSENTFTRHLVCSQCQSVIVPNKYKSHASNLNSSSWENLWLKQSWTVEWYVPNHTQIFPSQQTQRLFIYINCFIF